MTPEEPGWLELRMALWPHDDRAAHLAEMRRFCESPQRYAQFVAVSEEGAVQGFSEVSLRVDHVNGTTSSPVGFLEGLYVAPEARRRGIARELIAACERWALERGCHELASDALIDNVPSYRMHTALGFEETERVVFFRKSLR